MSNNTKFELFKFNGKGFATWKVKIRHISKGWMCCCFKGKKDKLVEMTDTQFAKKDEIAQADILLALEDKVLFNVKIVDTTAEDP